MTISWILKVSSYHHANAIMSSCHPSNIIRAVKRTLEGGFFLEKSWIWQKVIVWHHPAQAPFVDFLKFPSIQSWGFKFKSINHTYIQYWGSIPVQNNGIWLWDGGNSEKVIVWHLSSTHFSISHHKSCDQQT